MVPDVLELEDDVAAMVMSLAVTYYTSSVLPAARSVPSTGA
jgi:hypothetical protein